MKIPYIKNGATSGFPSPAQDYIENRINLNDLLIKKPTSTYILKADGDASYDNKINKNDLLIVDSSITPKQNDLVVAKLQGEFKLRKLILKPKLQLQSLKNPLDIYNINEEELEIFGVITFIIHQC